MAQGQRRDRIRHRGQNNLAQLPVGLAVDCGAQVRDRQFRGLQPLGSQVDCGVLDREPRDAAERAALRAGAEHDIAEFDTTTAEGDGRAILAGRCRQSKPDTPCQQRKPERRIARFVVHLHGHVLDGHRIHDGTPGCIRSSGRCIRRRRRQQRLPVEHAAGIERRGNAAALQ